MVHCCFHGRVQKGKATVGLAFDRESTVWMDGIEVFVKMIDFAGLGCIEAIIHIT